MLDALTPVSVIVLLQKEKQSKYIWIIVVIVVVVMFTKGQVERGRASLDLHRQQMLIPNVPVDTPEEITVNL